MAFTFYSPPMLNPEQSGFNPLADVLKGMQQRQLYQKQQMENEKAKAELPFAAKDIETKIQEAAARAGLYGQQGKEIQYKIKNPWTMASGDTQLVMLAQQLKDQREKQHLSQPQNNVSINASMPNGLLQPNQPQTQDTNTGYDLSNPEQLIKTIMQRKQAASDYQNLMSKGFIYTHATPDAKNYMIAQLAGMGVDPEKAVRLLTSGMSVDQIAQMQGFDPAKKPEPDFLPTSGNITTLKKTQAALAGMNSLHDFVESSVEPYSQKWFGYSPEQILAASKNENTDKMARFWAAQALIPELSNLRLTALQARGNKYAVQEMTNQAMSHVASFAPQMNPEIYKGMQKYIKQEIDKAYSQVARSYQVGNKKEQEQSENKSEQKVSKRWVRDESGNLVQEG
jgi:hypothetical protein